MFVVTCSDRILFLEESPLSKKGKLKKEFIEMYFGNEEEALEDIEEIGGPFAQFEVSCRLSTSVIQSKKSTKTLYFDTDEKKWIE